MNSILIALVNLVSLLNFVIWQASFAHVTERARIVAGEARGCPFEAKVAAVQVMDNREKEGLDGGWFASYNPTPEDFLAVLVAKQVPDLVDGAIYFIGPGDLAKFTWSTERTNFWACNGTWVESRRSQ